MGSEAEAATEFRHPSSKKRYLVPGLLSLLLIVTAVLCVVFIALYATEAESNSDSSSSSSSSTGSNVCQTEGCFDVAVQILGAMDEDVDPCEDFYNFTCGNWAKFQGIPADQVGLGALSLQQRFVYNDLADALESDITGGNRILSELEDLYSSCLLGLKMTQEEIDNSLIPVIRQVYQDLGGWDVVDIPGDGTEWTINSNQFIREKRFGNDAFYTIGVGFDADAFQFTLEIDQAGLTVDRRFYPFSFFRDGLVDLIITFLTELAQLEEPTTAINSTAEEIVQLETQLAEIWGFYSFNENVTVEDLYLLWPDHDWLTVLKGVFQPSGVEIEPSSTVYIGNYQYFINLTDVVRNTPNEVLENYAKWQMTWQLSQIFMPDSNIRNAMIYFKEVFLRKPSMEERQECVEFADSVMPIAMGRVYAEYVLPEGYKEAGEDLVTEVMAGLRQRMMEMDWLDSITRERAIEKLDVIESRVAYPERTFDDDYLEMLYGIYKFDDKDLVHNVVQYYNISHRIQYSMVYQSLDRSVWLASPSTVNAYYIAQFNQISILEGIMRTPTFSTEWPLSMQYGALGTILGHELTHGFDNNGRRFDKDGRRRMWWTQQSIDNFNDRAQCFVDQYSNYELYGLPVDGNLTLGENIADNGGISASYDAYKKVAGNGKILPGLTEYDDDQLFFIAFSQLWCSSFDEFSYYFSLFDEHSPGPFRVIGTVSNSKAFAEAFDCPANAPMNPPDKCELW